MICYISIRLYYGILSISELIDITWLQPSLYVIYIHMSVWCKTCLCYINEINLKLHFMGRQGQVAMTEWTGGSITQFCMISDIKLIFNIFNLLIYDCKTKDIPISLTCTSLKNILTVNLHTGSKYPLSLVKKKNLHCHLCNLMSSPKSCHPSSMETAVRLARQGNAGNSIGLITYMDQY